ACIKVNGHGRTLAGDKDPASVDLLIGNLGLDRKHVVPVVLHFLLNVGDVSLNGAPLISPTNHLDGDFTAIDVPRVVLVECNATLNSQDIEPDELQNGISRV